ncbi:hypothetical protein SteCoe_818 [Stentor coeruleus]|uniref:NECAP PHear domain-containing protein n=1 Tax=Stentor coeruleus TaxID=5963 RepID=A0A1R2D3A1_9CILI|nr:hypothetical protein SteCoe_818 [Stentor coeruleus]
MEEIEYTLLQKPDCKAYEIPPAVRSSGHLAEEWKNCIFQGKLRLVAKGKFCFIQLLTRDNSLFLACQVNPKFIERTVERTKDSSRYYVLTVVTPNGSNVYIGMGFDERNDAFDFWATLLDFAERIKTEEQPVVEVAGPDLSHLQLRDGQMISLSGGNKPVVANPPATQPKLFKLKPPPK